MKYKSTIALNGNIFVLFFISGPAIQASIIPSFILNVRQIIMRKLALLENVIVFISKAKLTKMQTQKNMTCGLFLLAWKPQHIPTRDSLSFLLSPLLRQLPCILHFPCFVPLTIVAQSSMCMELANHQPER